MCYKPLIEEKRRVTSLGKPNANIMKLPTVRYKINIPVTYLLSKVCNRYIFTIGISSHNLKKKSFLIYSNFGRKCLKVIVYVSYEKYFIYIEIFHLTMIFKNQPTFRANTKVLALNVGFITKYYPS